MIRRDETLLVEDWSHVDAVKHFNEDPGERKARLRALVEGGEASGVELRRAELREETPRILGHVAVAGVH